MKLRTVVLILIMNFILVSYGYAQAVQCSCDSCHGNPPTVDTLGGPEGIWGVGPTAGAHTHFTKIKQNLTCDACHFGGMPDSPLIDKKLQIGFYINGKSGAGMAYDGLVSIKPGFTYEATNGSKVTQNGTMKCSNVYCHGGGTGGTNHVGGTSKSITLNKINDPRSVAPSISPAWNDLIPLGCDYCHGYPPKYSQDDPKSNTHWMHGGAMSRCYWCHYKTTRDGKTIYDVTKHHNGIYEVDPDPRPYPRQPDDWHSGPISFTYTYDAGGGRCDNVACHSGFSKTWGNQGRSVYLSSTQGTVSYQMNLIASNNAGGTLMGSAPYTYEWDFGDGMVEAGTAGTTPITVTHTYPNTYPINVTYMVTFNFRDSKHHPGSGTMQVTPKYVAPPAPVPVPFTVKGNIKHAAGQPFSGVTVQLYKKTGEYIRSRITDSNGNYEISTNETSTHVIVPAKSGSTFVPISVEVSTNTNDVNFIGTP